MDIEGKILKGLNYNVATPHALSFLGPLLHVSSRCDPDFATIRTFALFVLERTLQDISFLR